MVPHVTRIAYVAVPCLTNSAFMFASSAQHYGEVARAAHINALYITAAKRCLLITGKCI